MASFITRQQHDNISHVDRSPYSPRRSGGAAQPPLTELIPRSPSPLAQNLSPSCFVPLQPDELNYNLGFVRSPPPPHSSQHDCMLFRVAIIKHPVYNCDKIPTGGKKATRHHARGSVTQTAESLQRR